MKESHLKQSNKSDQFTLYIFASELSYAEVLTQPNEQKIEAPISFFNSNFQGDELNYFGVERKPLQFTKPLISFYLFS